jgi:phosphoglycolate phosphatase-like HAD superfamily hydrolase
MKTRLVVFDMDGVILDSIPTLRELALNTICKHFHVCDETAHAYYEQTLGLPFQKQLETVFLHHPKNELATLDYEDKHSKMCPALPLSPFAETVMRTLRREGIRAALATSTYRWMLLKNLPQVRALGFDYLGGYIPPRMDKTYQIEAAMGITLNLREKTLFVGDTEQDKHFADQAGVSFFQVQANQLYNVLNHLSIQKWEEE